MRPDTDFTRLGWKKAQVAEVASLFKLFFREMPDSLLQHELYDCFISVFGMWRGEDYQWLRERNQWEEVD